LNIEVSLAGTDVSLVITLAGSSGDGSGNIDGGNASSIYLEEQLIDGGGA